jgi:hypothetical protein
MLEELSQQSDRDLEMQAPANGFRPLDPRAVKMWRLTDLTGYGIMLIFMLALLLPTRIARIGYWPWILAGWAVLALLAVIYSLWRPPRYYRSWSYRIDGRVLETRSGIIFHRTRLLPLSRLQHVDIERGPFARMYGLASLVLHTAGTHSANIRIPGLDADEALRLRDRLVEIGGDDAV